MIRFTFSSPKSPAGWDEGWPKTVTGICSICNCEGSEFQVQKFKEFICGKCKVELGRKLLGKVEGEE